MDFNKRQDEDDIQYLMRLVGYKIDSKVEDLDWEDIVEKCSLGVHRDVLRKAVQPKNFGAYDIYKYMMSKDITEDELLSKIILEKRELYKEQQINRDILNEYKALMREDCRITGLERIIDEKFEKKISKSPLKIPNKIQEKDNEKEIIVAFSDAHYGADFCITDFLGRVINKYNKEEYEKRMWQLRDEIIDFSNLHNCKKIRIVDGGDSLEGKIHLSQLQSLKSNVVDDIIDYSDFIVSWINSLDNEFIIDFYTSEGNHSDLRLLTGKKGDFPHENLERIYYKWLINHFKDNPNVTINANKDGLNYFDVLEYKFLTAHGQNEKNIENSIGKYESLYGISINYFIVGHMHSKKELDISGDKEVIQVRSIMGMNDFSEMIGKNSPSGALIFTVEKNKGKRDIREIKF